MEVVNENWLSWESKKIQLFQGMKLFVSSFSVNYYNQKGTWLDSMIFQVWFSSVWSKKCANLKQKNILDKNEIMKKYWQNLYLQTRLPLSSDFMYENTSWTMEGKDLRSFFLTNGNNSKLIWGRCQWSKCRKVVQHWPWWKVFWAAVNRSW